MLNANDLEALDRLVRGGCSPSERADLEARIRRDPEMFEQYKLSRLLYHMLTQRKARSAAQPGNGHQAQSQAADTQTGPALESIDPSKPL